MAAIATPAVYTTTVVQSGEVEAVTAMAHGSIAVAFNEMFYSHRLWPGLPNAIPNDSAFFDAHCTALTTPAETWECSSWSVTISMNASISDKPYTTPVTMYPSSTVLMSENMYTISAISLYTVLPSSSWTPSSETATTEGAKASSGTIEHAPVQTSNAMAVARAQKLIIPMPGVMLSTIAFIASM